MSRSHMGMAVVACFVVLLLSLAASCQGDLDTNSNGGVYDTSRLIGQGTMVDVKQGHIYAWDSVANGLMYTEVMMSWDGVIWDHKLPISCNELDTQLVKIRRTSDPLTVVETFVIIQDNSDMCPE